MSPRRCFAMSCVGGALLFAAASFAAKSDPPAGLKLLFSDDFEKGNMDAWEPTDPKAWKVTKDGESQVLALTGQSDYKPPVRSPLSFALIKGVDVGDFVMETRLKSTTKDYDHRDLCVIFDHQDASHFYYVHMALHSDDHANSIFIVDGKPRLTIANKRTAGTQWTDDWHKVRVVRRAAEGAIEVYFDNMDEPAFAAQDKTFAHGRVGVGSFDDTGNFDEVKLWGTPAK